jgi:hypothetical protein
MTDYMDSVKWSDDGENGLAGAAKPTSQLKRS